MSIGLVLGEFALVILAIYYCKAIYRFLLARWYYSKIPGPGKSAYPIIGHAGNLFNGSPEISLQGILKQHQLLIKNNQKLAMTWLGPMPTLWLFHPDLAEELLHNSIHIDKSYLYSFLKSWLGTGLAISKKQKWQQRRKLITPTFHFTILEDFLEVMNDNSQKLLLKLQDLRKNNSDIDLQKCLTLCTLDIICETAMGKSVNAQKKEDSKYAKALERISDLIMYRMLHPWLWSDFIFYKTRYGIEHEAYLKILHDFTKSVIKDRSINTSNLEGKKKRKMALLDVLLTAKTDDGKTLSYSGIQEEVDTFMFAGNDTTSIAMTWTLYLLGRHPDIQRKVQKEIDDVMAKNDNKPFSITDLKDLKYLEQVIKESLRFYTVAPELSRVTSQDCVIDGYLIPEGTNVHVFIQSIHKHPEIWENPDQFDPDRFSKENSSNRHPFAFIPFSAGPRNCIGQRFAVFEMKTILSYILRHFNITSTTKREDVKLCPNLLMRPDKSLDLQITERNCK